MRKQWTLTCIRYMLKQVGTHRHSLPMMLLFVLASGFTLSYYLNYPQVELNVDTPAYLDIVPLIQSHFGIINAWRLPGYPLFITLIYSIAGQNNLTAVSIVQAIFFVAATLELYVVAFLIVEQRWLAFLIGLLVGTNLVLISYIKPIMSEGLALWILTTLVLVVIYIVRKRRLHYFWLVIACLFALLFTRPEWLYLPIPLCICLLLIMHATRLQKIRRLLVAGVIIYGALAGYVLLNTLINYYPGLTAIENYNLLGKVLQYKMQDEAPPEYVSISHKLDYYVRHVDNDPYHILRYIPELSRNDAIPAGAFARSVIVQHPLEFALKSVPFFFSSLTDYYDVSRTSIAGPLDSRLDWLKSFHRMLYAWNSGFPFCALFWFFLLCWPRTRSCPIVLPMNILVLIVVYAVVVTTLGGYRPDDYMRIHIVFDPLVILVIWGSIFIAIYFFLKVFTLCFEFLFISILEIDKIQARVKDSVKKLLNCYFSSLSSKDVL